MSSTYVHYSAPASLPSDYALLSRYAVRNNAGNVDDDDDETSSSSDENSIETLDVQVASSSSRIPIRPGYSSPRRSSFPSQYIRPLNPRLATLPTNVSGSQPWSGTGSTSIIPSENTPLLGPLVPRIHEDVGSDSDGRAPDAIAAHSSKHHYWEECVILLKYTMPVFG